MCRSYTHALRWHTRIYIEGWLWSSILERVNGLFQALSVSRGLLVHAYVTFVEYTRDECSCRDAPHYVCEHKQTPLQLIPHCHHSKSRTRIPRRKRRYRVQALRDFTRRSTVGIQVNIYIHIYGTVAHPEIWIRVETSKLKLVSTIHWVDTGL